MKKNENSSGIKSKKLFLIITSSILTAAVFWFLILPLGYSLLKNILPKNKDVKFEAFSAEAFAFDIGDGIAEVNATVRVKGFTQTEKDNNYKAEIAYDVDLINPDSIIKKSVFKFVQEKEGKEPIADIALESQFSLDSTYLAGTYTLVFNIADKNSESKTEAKVSFELERDL